MTWTVLSHWWNWMLSSSLPISRRWHKKYDLNCSLLRVIIVPNLSLSLGIVANCVISQQKCLIHYYIMPLISITKHIHSLIHYYIMPLISKTKHIHSLIHYYIMPLISITKHIHSLIHYYIMPLISKTKHIHSWTCTHTWTSTQRWCHQISLFCCWKHTLKQFLTKCSNYLAADMHQSRVER